MTPVLFRLLMMVMCIFPAAAETQGSSANFGVEACKIDLLTHCHTEDSVSHPFWEVPKSCEAQGGQVNKNAMFHFKECWSIPELVPFQGQFCHDFHAAHSSAALYIQQEQVDTVSFTGMDVSPVLIRASSRRMPRPARCSRKQGYHSLGSSGLLPVLPRQDDCYMSEQESRVEVCRCWHNSQCKRYSPTLQVAHPLSPGMRATPGYHNAQVYARVCTQRGQGLLGSTRSCSGGVTVVGECSSYTKATMDCFPGIWATPGDHNAQTWRWSNGQTALPLWPPQQGSVDPQFCNVSCPVDFQGIPQSFGCQDLPASSSAWDFCQSQVSTRWTCAHVTQRVRGVSQPMLDGRRENAGDPCVHTLGIHHGSVQCLNTGGLQARASRASPRSGTSLDPGKLKERVNSQRPGRKNPEEKKSGKTHNQPAVGTQEPEKQPACRPQEPDKICAVGTQAPMPMSFPSVSVVPGLSVSESIAELVGCNYRSWSSCHAVNLVTHMPMQAMSALTHEDRGQTSPPNDKCPCPGIWATPGNHNAHWSSPLRFRSVDGYQQFCQGTAAPTLEGYSLRLCGQEMPLVRVASQPRDHYLQELTGRRSVQATPLAAQAGNQGRAVESWVETGEMSYKDVHAMACHISDRSCTSRGLDSTKARNSQRSGRKNPEEKKSGMTHNQPAARTQAPGKQPASRTQEPDKNSAVGTREPLPRSWSSVVVSLGPVVTVSNANSDAVSSRAHSQKAYVGSRSYRMDLASAIQASATPASEFGSPVDPQGTRRSPGMRATPGHHNALTPTGECSPGSSCPGMWATPGHQNAHRSPTQPGHNQLSAEELQTRIEGATCASLKAARFSPPLPVRQAASVCPGIWATPGYHNAHQACTLWGRVSRPSAETDHISDESSLMAAGVHTRRHRVGASPEPQLEDHPAIAVQEQDQELEFADDPESSDDSSSEENPAWRDFYVYTVHQPPLQVSLNMVSPRLRHHQCARALGWTAERLQATYQVEPCPEDLRQSRLRGMLARSQADPPEGGALAMALIDVEFHPPAPRWDPEIIRSAMFLPQDLSNHQFMVSMHLMPYCRYNRSPCLLLLRDQRVNLDHEVAMHITDGTYVRVVLPPPNMEDEAVSTRCIAMACYQDIGQEFFDIFDHLVEEYNLWSMPNPSQVLVVSSSEEEVEDDQVELLQRFHRRITHSSAISTHGPTPASSVLQSQGHSTCLMIGMFGTENPIRSISRRKVGKTSSIRRCQCRPHREGTKSFLSMHRVGEASKPGPGPASQEGWTIAAINPTGLAGKAKQFCDMPKGIYAISETHLSARGQARFREELFHAKTKLKLYPGYRAPLKKDSIQAVGGKHTGVAFLTEFPTRPITSGWNTELYQTSRIHAAVFLVNNTWIAGGVCYGYAKDSDSPAVQEHTNDLLQELAKQVQGFKGPAFIAGDFNQTPGILPETLRWEQRGWRDIQTWAAEKYGINPGVTCQFTTRKDFVYVSPELQVLIQSCSNSFDRWPDHSTLMGTFEPPSAPEPLPRWNRPAAIDYSQLDSKVIAAHPCDPAPVCDAPTEQYKAICQKFEQHVHACLTAKGKVGLQPGQRGRGQTLQRSFRPNLIAPVKPARQGDFQPSVHTWSLLHSRWITQCRRLQSYAKHVGKGSVTPTAIEHRAALWLAIRKALGFSGGFPQWWMDQAANHPNLIPWIPFEPPGVSIAQHISDQFLTILSAMETHIIKQRVAKARQTRIDDTNRVFKDVRRPMPVPVSMLVAKASTQVTVVVDEGSVEVADSSPIQTASVLETRTGPMQVIHIEENQVWFTSPHTLVPGDEVAMVELQGRVQDVHNAFLQEWTKRWDRHRHLSPDHWEEVIALTKTILHAEQMELAPISVDKWKHALRSKKATAATGLDGVARRDLLSFPDVLHEQLLSLFMVAERTGHWPQQLLQGAVHALEKTANAETVSQYRPITIMPCAYRTYSSIRAREVLKHLAKVLPPTLLGNIPGKQAIGLWWTLQHRIEQAMYAEEPLTGVVSDLCKAFNHLPREVTFQAALSLGVHPDIVRAWAASTVFLQRHFVVRDCPSAQVTSTTGFVEGCGMSVVGMVLINALVHAYMQHQHPHTVFTTYVDNYELQASTAEQTTQALSSLQRFCDLLDVQLDGKKTYHWACDATGRAKLRAQHDIPVRAAKDLGAHMQYTANQTNGTVLAKFRQLPELWHKLARSHAPQSQKLKVLRVVAWPRTLYSGAIVHIGPAHFDEARAGAAKAIGMQKSGANAQIFLSLVANVSSDPGFFALWNAITQFRRHMVEELLDVTLQQAAVTPPRKRKPGPGGVLITRLEQVCWTYVANGVFRDGEGGLVHILHTPRQELKARVSRAWQHAVGRRWEHRKGFQGLRFVCPMLSKIDATKFAPDAVGFLQVAQTAAFYTADCLQHSGFTDSSLCIRCAAEDSVEHRHWQCPATAASRELIPPDIQAQIDRQEPCLREHGWMPEPPEVRDFKRSLNSIGDTMCHFATVGAQAHYDLFCDGTGRDPKQPQTRLVGWAVVLAGTDPLMPHQPLAWGGVPGQWQTVMRAELMAFVSAIRFGSASGATFAVWSDCEVIVKRARRIQAGLFDVTSTCTDHDLWTLVHTLMPPDHICSLHHIKSHQQYSGEESWIQWACSANDTADLLAAWALDNLPHEVRVAQQKASLAVQEARLMVQHVHAHMVRVAQLSVAAPSAPPAPVARLPDTMVMDWKAVADRASQDAPENLRFPRWLTILDWMREIESPGTAPRWLSWFELLVSYQLFAGEWGPESTSCHNTWRMHPGLQEYSGKQMLRSWAAYLINLIRLLHPHFKPIDGRPSDPRFTCWTMGILCKISEASSEAVRCWLDSELGEKRISKMSTLHQTGPARAVRPLPRMVNSDEGLHRFWRSQR